MEKTTRTKLWLLGLALAVTVPVTSQAGLTQLDIDYSTAYSEHLTVQGGPIEHVYATAFLATYVSGDALPNGHGNPFLTVCLDINQNLADGYWKSGAYNNNILTAQSAPATRQGVAAFRKAANMYAIYAPSIFPAGGNWANATTQQKIDGAALQAAIWEVLYEPAVNGYDVTSTVGTTGFKITDNTGNNATINARANQMLLNAIDTGITTTFWNATDANGISRASQDLMGPFSNNAVPEPSTIIAGALLLLPFGASTLRKLRPSRVA